MNFWASSVWGFITLLAALMLGLLIANIIKRRVPFIRKSLIPTSVLGGLLVLIFSITWQAISKTLGAEKTVFDSDFFGGNGSQMLEIITYHCLALGFIASALKTSKNKVTGKRVKEVFNTGVTTVSTYLIQAIFGLAITIVFGKFVIPELIEGSGVLLCLGFGQGTGQALNFGRIYENEHGFVNGANFGLSIACLGFLAASIGGVIYLNIVKKRRGIVVEEAVEKPIGNEEIQGEDEIPVNGGLDKITFQLIFIVVCYFLTFLAMFGLSKVLPGMKDTIYGFNFFFGVLIATLFKKILNFCKKKKIVKRVYLNNFFLDRVSNFFFDLMIVSGIAAIRLDFLGRYWYVLLILAVGGTLITFFYNLFVAKVLFPEYKDEQFLVMYGMLTGTASSGMVLLRELDPNYKTPASENLVFQNFPAIVFGFPLMTLATMAPDQPYLVLGLIAIFFAVLVIILFRSKIFRFKKKGVATEVVNEESTAVESDNSETQE
ncbi:MAG: sodium/glutamate symporter [Bacilli bacterium]